MAGPRSRVCWTEKVEGYLIILVGAFFLTCEAEVIKLCSNQTVSRGPSSETTTIIINDRGTREHPYEQCSCTVTATEFEMKAAVVAAQPSALLQLKVRKQRQDVSKSMSTGETIQYESLLSAEVAYKKATADDTPMSAIFTFKLEQGDQLNIACQTSGWLEDDTIFQLINPQDDKRFTQAIRDDLPIVITLAVIIAVLLILSLVFLVSCCKFKRLSKELDDLRQNQNGPTVIKVAPMTDSRKANIASWADSASPEYQPSFEPLPDVFPPEPPSLSSIPQTPVHGSPPPAVPTRPPETLPENKPRSVRSSNSTHSPAQRLLSSTPKSMEGPAGGKDTTYYSTLEGTYLPVS